LGSLSKTMHHILVPDSEFPLNSRPLDYGNPKMENPAVPNKTLPVGQ